MSNEARFKNKAIVGRPFVVQLDVKKWDHSTNALATVDISSATDPKIRLVAPDGTATEHTATIPGSPNNLIQYSSSDGSELTAAGDWEAVAIYTLSGTRETFPISFTVEEAVADP